MMFGYDWGLGYWGAGHWIGFAVIIAAVLYPIGRILARLGFSPYLAVAALIPIVNLIGLWALALMDWPAQGTVERPPLDRT